MIETGMADGEHPVSAPLTPVTMVIPPAVSEVNVDNPVGTSHLDPTIDREEYIYQLEDQLQELRDTVQQLQR